MGLATQLSGMTLPSGIFEWLGIHADALRDDSEIAENEIDEAISSISASSYDTNVMETLGKITDVLVKLEARVETIVTTQNTDERERQLVKFDGFIAWLGFVLSVIMAIVQLVDRPQGEVNHKELILNDARIEEKIDSVQRQFERITSAVAYPDLRVCMNDTPLRPSPWLRSIPICKVKEYQIISVARLLPEDEKAKWIYVKFIENGTGLHKEGWALQKYFKKWKARF